MNMLTKQATRKNSHWIFYTFSVPHAMATSLPTSCTFLHVGTCPAHLRKRVLWLLVFECPPRTPEEKLNCVCAHAWLWPGPAFRAQTFHPPRPLMLNYHMCIPIFYEFLSIFMFVLALAQGCLAKRLVGGFRDSSPSVGLCCNADRLRGDWPMLQGRRAVAPLLSMWGAVEKLFVFFFALHFFNDRYVWHITQEGLFLLLRRQEVRIRQGTTYWISIGQHCRQPSFPKVSHGAKVWNSASRRVTFRRGFRRKVGTDHWRRASRCRSCQIYAWTMHIDLALPSTSA